jgi:hypothetical protein
MNPFRQRDPASAPPGTDGASSGERRDESPEDRPRGGSPGLVMGFLGMSLFGYVLSPPFVISLCHLLGLPWNRVRDTFYLPLVMAFFWAPKAWERHYEVYVEFVIRTLRLPVP